MNKKIQVSILSIFIAAALIGSVAAVGNNMAFAGGNDHDDDKEKDKKSHHDGKKRTSNEALQGIGQSTETAQLSECGSGNDTTASCNNVALSFNLNDGNNALGQQ
ncbi:hypothetical protein [Candidatus Nitrosocosmicus arcticus]|uniref:Uncharacterized protein n=1 Tax=Candidatus Nitrosocosmicus arcticus TaxID=2035267 RepID=A0A557SYN4_9ARCH|nr:hypothetical protein [Candidatus Nitrosocosmicus arcticus]TVP41719.1 exported protein of unknown function [Candidatus Nitrosocosmicus arcticus]